MAQPEVIAIDQVPTRPEWAFPILYKLDQRGREASWQVAFDGFDQLVMTFGKVGGAIRETRSRVVPKSNRTMIQQALQEARTRYDLKISKDGYHQDGEVTQVIQPMLAHKWAPGTRLAYPVVTQPKLDGVRCLGQVVNGSVELRTRNNKPIHHLNHIRQALLHLSQFLPPETIYDGELYAIDQPFNVIISIVKQEISPHPREEILSYFMFDLILPQDPGFVQRYDQLTNAYYDYADAGYFTYDPEGNVADPLRVVESSIAESAEDLLSAHTDYVENGYEGLIIRQPNSIYSMTRTRNLLKYKQFIDEEVTIVDVRDATGTEAGAALLMVRDDRGNTLPVRFRGSFDQRRQWLQHPEDVIGQRATIRYQELTPDGVPRFPVGVGLRNYE